MTNDIITIIVTLGIIAAFELWHYLLKRNEIDPIKKNMADYKRGRWMK